MAIDFPDTTQLNPETGLPWANGDTYLDVPTGLRYFWFAPVWKRELQVTGPTDEKYVERDGDTMTGQLTLPGGGAGSEAITVDEVNAKFKEGDIDKYVEKSGDDMSGNLTFDGDKLTLGVDGSITASGNLDVGEYSNTGLYASGGSKLYNTGRLFLRRVGQGDTTDAIKLVNGLGTGNDYSFKVTTDGSVNTIGDITLDGNLRVNNSSGSRTGLDGNGIFQRNTSDDIVVSIIDDGSITAKGDIKSQTGNSTSPYAALYGNGRCIIKSNDSKAGDSTCFRIRDVNAEEVLTMSSGGRIIADGNIRSVEGNTSAILGLTAIDGSATNKAHFQIYDSANNKSKAYITADGNITAAGNVKTTDGVITSQHDTYNFIGRKPDGDAIFAVAADTQQIQLGDLASGNPSIVLDGTDGSAEFARGSTWINSAGNVYLGTNGNLDTTPANRKISLGASGSATFEGSVVTGPLSTEKNTTSTNYIWRKTQSPGDALCRFKSNVTSLTSGDAAAIYADGKAQFANIGTFGPYDVSKDNVYGVQVNSGGVLRVQRESTSNSHVFQGYKGKTATSEIFANGSAIFESSVYSKYSGKGQVQIAASINHGIMVKDKDDNLRANIDWDGTGDFEDVKVGGTSLMRSLTHPYGTSDHDLGVICENAQFVKIKVSIGNSSGNYTFQEWNYTRGYTGTNRYAISKVFEQKTHPTGAPNVTLSTSDDKVRSTVSGGGSFSGYYQIVL